MPASRTGRWQGEPARLDQVLAELGLARSRSHAAELIAAGNVQLAGTVTHKAGARVTAGTELTVTAADHYVSRAAHKLIAGLDAFQVQPSSRLALDVGASTGGFTQVLLERGARAVIALDVGHGQLAPAIRNDPRVHVVEGCNARKLTALKLAQLAGTTEQPSLLVCDLSFISLELVFPAFASVLAPGGEIIALVKPQFEVGRQGVRGGIVKNPQLACEAVARVILAAHRHQFSCRGLVASPITGEHGNREVLMHLVYEHQVHPREWNERIREIFVSGGE